MGERAWLERRASGAGYEHIAFGEDADLDRVLADVRAELARYRDALEPGDLADALALVRLDRLEESVNQVLAHAQLSCNHDLALRAADRILLIHERRAAVMPARAVAGPMETAVRAEVHSYPEAEHGSSTAVAAILLSRRMDAGLPAQDLGGVARELRITLRILAERAPKEAETSTRDDLRARREDRIAKEIAATR